MFDKDTKLFLAISAIALAFIIYISSGSAVFQSSATNKDFSFDLHKVLGVYGDDFYYVIETGKDDNGETCMYIQDLAKNEKIKNGEVIDIKSNSIEAKLAKPNEELGTDYMGGLHIARGRYILETTGFKENIEVAKEILKMIKIDNIDLDKVQAIYIDREHSKVPLGSAQLSFADIEDKRLLSMELYYTIDDQNKFMLKEMGDQNVQEEPEVVKDGESNENN